VFRLRMIGGAVSALVLAALSVGMASPATAAGPLPQLAGACGGSMSSVTACPSNVLMLKEAGILAMPATGGGTVGVVAAPATSTAGSAVGGVLETLGVLGGSFFALSQLFGTDGKASSSATLNTTGTSGQNLGVGVDAQFGALGAWSSPQSCKTNPAGCSWVTSRSSIGKVGSPDHWEAYQFSYTPTNNQPETKIFLASGATQILPGGGSQWVNASCQGFDANGYAIPENVPGKMCVRWSYKIGATPAVDPIVAIQVTGGAKVNVTQAVVPADHQDGTVTRHLWCANPSGTSPAMVDYMTAQIATLRPGQSVNLQDMKCPGANQVAVDTSMDWAPSDGSAGTAIVPRTNWAPGSNPVIDAAVARPQCATGSCLLVLTHTDGRPCGSVGELCPDWAKDPNYSQNYQCKFGGELVSLDYCSAYRSPADGVQPNTKSDGSLYRPTDPAVKPGGRPVTDPTATPGPGGVQPAPAPVDTPMTNTDPNNCRTSSWIENLNPFTMFTTIGCALKDGFVPDPVKVQTAVQGVQTSWSQTPPAKVAGMVTSITAALPAGSGCSGISFTFPGVLGVAAQNFTLLNACSEPVAGVAMIVRIIGAIGMIVFGILALTKMAGGVIALPGLGKTGGDS
jgi:hypothetical protein